MNKPLTVERQEFTENIVTIINNAKLPAFVMLDIIKSIAGELGDLSQKQYENDKATWERSQVEEKKLEDQ